MLRTGFVARRVISKSEKTARPELLHFRRNGEIIFVLRKATRTNGVLTLAARDFRIPFCNSLSVDERFTSGFKKLCLCGVLILVPLSVKKSKHEAPAWSTYALSSRPSDHPNTRSS